MKFIILLIGFIACLLFLCYQIIMIKREKGIEYEMAALRQLVDNTTGDQVILPNRGAIMDRNKQALAISSTVYDIVLDVRTILSYETENAQQRFQARPQDEKDTILQKRQQTLEIIHQVLAVENGIEGITMESLQGYLAIDPEKNRPAYDTFYLIIAQNVPRNIATALTSALKEQELRHVYAMEDTERKYIYNNLSSAVLGFIRGDASWGLELQYDALLAGVPGRLFNAFGETGSVQSERVPPVEGHTLITTLDLAIQQSAERICEKYAKMYDAPYSTAIVMNPNTAELYAMAQYPSVNLNAPSDLSFINKEEYATGWANLPDQELADKLNSIWANFNLTSTFEPGSIYKPLTVAAALEEGVLRTDQTFVCNGELWYGETRIPCHKLDGHGTQTLEQALANSCNVAMMEIAEKLGRESFYEYLTSFGYGDRTGIDLPGENFGRLHAYDNFRTVELAVASFGQRFTCTPIQAITSFCATINGGNVMRPYIVAQVVNEKGQVIQETKPLVQRRIISKETSDYLRTAMEAVMRPTGTGRKAVIEGWAIGGKTATGQQGIPGSDDYAFSLSFITYFPVENPQYAVLVLLHNVSEEIYDNGAASAAGMSKELMLDIIKYKAIPPSYELGESTLQMTNSLLMENYIGMTVAETTKRLNALHLDYELIGGSCALVTGQFPLPNARIPENTLIFLTAEPQDGVTLVEVPEVTEMESAQAAALLSAAGFVPHIVIIDETALSPAPATEAPETAETPTPIPPGIVQKQSPEAGIRAMQGTEVRLKVQP